jgi:hypothetical protein
MALKNLKRDACLSKSNPAMDREDVLITKHDQ